MSLSKRQQTESVLVYICPGRRDRLQPFVLKGFLSYDWSVGVCFWVGGGLFVAVLRQTLPVYPQTVSGSSALDMQV